MFRAQTEKSAAVAQKEKRSATARDGTDLAVIFCLLRRYLGLGGVERGGPLDAGGDEVGHGE